MNIYDALSKDHRQFESIIDRLVTASNTGGEEWKRLLDELRAGLVPHAHAEEAVFYNALREADQAKSLVAHSYGEHLMAETELRALEGLKKFDQSSATLVEKLRKDLRHHIEEEEGKVFDAARQVFSEEEAAQIGAAFSRLKSEMGNTAESMMASNLALIANMLPPRLVEGFKRTVDGWKNQKAA